MLHSATRALRPSLTTTRLHPRIQACSYSDLNTAFPLPFTPPIAARKHRAKTGPKRKPLAVANLVPENRCAQVRTWELLRDTSEFLTLIRAVEQKYGPIESFDLRKDIDSPTIYQTIVWITFRSLESFNRLPKKFEVHHVRPPKVDPRQPGGIGLNDFTSSLTNDVEFLTADQVSQTRSDERTVNFRIERAQKPFIKESPYKFFGHTSTYRQSVASNMLKWGGFHGMKSLSSRQRITNADLTNETIDHVFMRKTLREWAELSGERNPYENSTADSEDSQATTLEESARMTRRVRNAWFSDVIPPPVTLDPLQQILDMESSGVVVKVAPAPGAGSEPENLPASLQGTTSTTDPHNMSHEGAMRIINLSATTPPSSTSPTQPATPSSHTESSESSGAAPQDPGPTTSLPLTITADPDMSPSCATTSSGPQKPDVSAIERSALSLEEAQLQGKIPIEFLEHEQKLLEPTASVDPTEEGKAKVAQEASGGPQSPELEHNPRFGDLYNKLRSVLNL